MDLPPADMVLTSAFKRRHSDVMRPGFLLYGRVHVDLVRHASACCPSP
ncbi:putative leader peptide [Streptomyces zagrosensis]|nr:putative leader peptide [Streptomyces zagrosensis]